MKLTKRGKRVRAVLLLIALLLTAKSIQFLATHHREEYNCRWNYEVAGTQCDMKWVRN